MVTLDNFYSSKAWIKFITGLKLERVNADGDLICEYCGKPIVNKYDAIGHHKEYLTEDNVNDVTVALNPDNISIVHHACHNKIHDKLGHFRRQIFLVYGAPLSGKSSYVNTVRGIGDLIIDIDLIWQCVTGSEKYNKPPVLNAVVFGIRDYLIESVRIRRGKWDNAYIIGGYPLISERERICKTLGAREVFIECSKDECMRRLSENSDGRDFKAWTGYINEWFRRYSPPLTA